MKAVHLRVEYLKDPIGIEAEHPRIQWQAEGGKKQTAYQVVTEKWDSKKVFTDHMYVMYPLDLTDGEEVHFKIRLYDENDVPGEWAEGSFERGIDLGAVSWITGNYKVDPKKRYPVDCFRKTFTAENISKARLYITACGLYEAKLNGERIGDFVLSPGITDYRKRVQYQTYDVQKLLKSGENELTVFLADGWYRGSVGAWGIKNAYGRETKLLACLVLTDADGKETRICTDESWNWSSDGPIRFADNKDGEIVDARLSPTYGKKAKKSSHPIRPTASDNVYVKEQEVFSGKIIETPSGKTVLDFGQNIAGYLSFSLDAHAGQTIYLRFGELIGPDGEFTQKNIQCSNKKITTPLQEVKYICKEGVNDYKTTFAVFGFQYVQVESDREIVPEHFKAIAIYSDLEQTSEFHSSNELLNRFYKSTVWSAKNNSCDLPTDCPTRERHGWAGDAQLFAGTASYLFSYFPFAKKFEMDLIDTQHKNGNVGQIAPYGGVDSYMKVMDGSAGWSDAIVLIPWKMYCQYGDERILMDVYPFMKRYAEYKMHTVGKWYPTAIPTGIGVKGAASICNFGQSYGEWAEPQDIRAFKIADFVSPHPEESTAYLVYLLEHMAKIAQVLNEQADQKRYEDFADKVREGYRKLVSLKKFSLDTDRQAKLVRPLYMGLLSEEQEEYAKKRLISALDSYRWRVGTGFLSTPLILFVLSSIDPVYAYKLLENEEIPGWLSMPKNGANTIWEAWEGPYTKNSGIASLNHYSKGAVLEWVFSVMCGITVKGENRFRIAPVPGGQFTQSSLKYNSIYGPVSCSWVKENERFKIEVEVPSNCTADFEFQNVHEVLSAGKYEFNV